MTFYSINSRDRGRVILHIISSVIFMVSIGYCQIQKEYSFQIESSLNEIKSSTSDFRYPKANSEIHLNDFLLDQFIWRFAGISSDIFQSDIILDDWEILDSSNLPINFQLPENFKFTESVEIGCPILKFSFLPWKVKNGNLYYCKKAIINIKLNQHKIEVPHIINDIHNNEILEKIISNDIEYIILAPDEFELHAEELKQLHSSSVPIGDQLNTDIIYISEMLNELEINNLSSYAIKDIIEIKINENLGLKYLLILGDETYFPPIYSNSTPSDDYYSSFEGILPTVATGRIPVADVNEAGFSIDKIIEYTLNPSPGIWKQKFMLTADDFRKEGYSPTSEIRHTQNSVDLYNIIKENAIVNTFYGSEYEPSPGEGWITLPELTNDVINGINSGTAVMNYIGHGSFDALADERILHKDRDIPLLIPEDNKYAIWVVGTCSFGHYDGEFSMAEALLNNPNGAIGLITTTRSVYTGTNIQFLTKIFTQFNDYFIGENDHRLGDVAFYAKTNSNSGTYSLFHLYGDPAMKLPFFRKDDLFNEEPQTIIEQMTPEYLDLSLEQNNQNIMTIKNNEYYNIVNADGYIYNILHPGNTILNNQLNQDNSFILPIDVPTCDSCLHINIYSENESNGSKFDYSNKWSLTENINFSNDFEGPQISLFINENKIETGDLINIPESITIKFEDENGINTYGGLGHEITFQINDEEKINITNQFEGISNTSGLINLNLNDYSKYENTINIIAWDNTNNKTEKSFTLFFIEGNEFKLENVYPYPNPFTEEVEFTFHINEASDIEISVFNLSGKKIYKRNYFNFQPGLIRTEKWNGFTSNGSPISNGAYFFVVNATSLTSGKSIQKLQKLAKISK